MGDGKATAAATMVRSSVGARRPEAGRERFCL